MRSIINNIIALVFGCATSAVAASGAGDEGSGFFLYLFIAMISSIIALQFIPGLVLFFGMLKGIFVKREEDTY